MHTADARQRLLAAGKTILREEGMEAVTVRRLAAAATCTYPLLYHYFPSLEAYFWELRLSLIADVVTELTALPPTAADPVEGLKQTFRAYAGYFFGNPTLFRFFFARPFVRPEGDTRYAVLEQFFHRQWVSSFAGLVQAGLLAAAEVETVAKTLIYAVQGMILLALSANGSLTEDAVYAEIDALLDFLLRKEHPHG